MNAETTLLEARGLRKTYGPVVALASANLSVQSGEVHALLGANGAGKSTLVKLLTGVTKPDEGEIRSPAATCAWARRRTRRGSASRRSSRTRRSCRT